MAEKNTENSNNNSSNGSRLKNTVRSLVDGMDSFLSAKTVLGDPVEIGDTVVLPLVDVSFGVGAGAIGQKSTDGNSGGAMHGKMTPSAVLVIKDGVARVVNIKDQDTLSKIMNIAPDVVDRVSSFLKKDGKKSDVEDDIDATINNIKNSKKDI